MKRIYIFNRTAANISGIINDFRSYHVEIIPINDLERRSYTHGLPIFVVGTVPAKATLLSFKMPDEVLDGRVILTKDIFARSDGGVMLDMAYLPKRTPLIGLAEQNSNWVANPGISILLEQAFAQFKLWTGVNPPRGPMTRAVLNRYEEEQKAEGAR